MAEIINFPKKAKMLIASNAIHSDEPLNPLGGLLLPFMLAVTTIVLFFVVMPILAILMFGKIQ